jgi:hypothetical protein
MEQLPAPYVFGLLPGVVDHTAMPNPAITVFPARWVAQSQGRLDNQKQAFCELSLYPSSGQECKSVRRGLRWKHRETWQAGSLEGSVRDDANRFERLRPNKHHLCSKSAVNFIGLHRPDVFQAERTLGPWTVSDLDVSMGFEITSIAELHFVSSAHSCIMTSARLRLKARHLGRVKDAPWP